MALHYVVTDSGVGGLSTCAELERTLRERRVASRLTYVNAWPSEQGGFNDMPDIQTEAHVFDRALRSIAALAPDRIVVACNTLSIVYQHTEYCRRAASTSDSASRLPPVLGIVDAGVELFFESLAAEPSSIIVLLGTKTTIGSGVHRARLIENGVRSDRIAAVGCHGLARSIETEMDGPATMALIDECSRQAAAAVGQNGERRLLLGICCTHYTYLREQMRAALERHAGQPVEVIDPTDRLVVEVLGADGGVADGAPQGAPTVTVVSKVRMADEKRHVIAKRLADASPATAEALLSYTHIPDMF